MRHRTFATLVLLQLVFGRSSAQVSRRAQSLLGQMTLEEKIGQLNLAAGVGLGGFVTGVDCTSPNSTFTSAPALRLVRFANSKGSAE